MAFAGFFLLGKAIKTHGLSGRLSVYFDVEDPIAYDQESVIYMELGGSLIPFFVSEISHKKGNVFTVLFQDVITEQDAKGYVGKSLYLSNERLVEPGDSQLDDFVGYTMFNQEQQEIGVVQGLEGSDLNPLAVVEYKGKLVFIPIQEDLILAIDDSAKSLQVQMAEGLLDL